MEKSSIKNTLSHNIRLLRTKRGWSQAQLAEKVGTSVNHISRIETSKKWPFPDTLQHLADSLGVDVYKLFMNETPISDKPVDSINQYKEDVKMLYAKYSKRFERALSKLTAKQATSND
ncbi:MAG: helix-turn-helix domain-containing protein [Spirochaetaceae bacterium]|nr:helix-turn-helix domain-containing protein [Spirochaetaceae bacterium]